MNLEIITILESVYVIYMLRFFKTKYSLAHPLTYFDNKYLYHPIGKSKKSISNICPFGHQASWFIGLFVLLRTIFIKFKWVKMYCIKLVSKFILANTIIFSLLNFNATIYLIPFFLLEIYLIKKNFVIV